jgi:YHS domain-containing protein
MTMTRTLRFTLPVVAALAFGALSFTTTSPAFAYDENSTASINVEGGVALKGYDPVAYFTSGKPTKGSANFTARHEGTTYHFASAENQRLFHANPSRFAPQYGGFCAMGAALGKKLDIDPTQFKVVDDKLYLNVNAEVFGKWSQDIPAHVRAADQNWPAIASKTPKSL